MVKMAQIENIRKMHFREGLSIREISRLTGHHRDTITKYLDMELVEPPRYKLIKERPHPVLDPYIPIIQEILASDENKPRKQRHTGMRIFRRLVDEYNFPGGYNTVADYLRQNRARRKEAFLPLQFGLGNQAQCDWGEAIFLLNGVETKAHIFIQRLSASGAIFAKAYPFEKQEAFFDGHRQAFEFFEGVPHRIAYDNLATAVKKILAGKDRVEQDNFIALRTHYLFEPDFCNPAKGNEKGGVEGSVRYIRQNFFVPVPEVRSFEELNEYLYGCCLKHRSKLALWEAERKELRLLPQLPFPCFRHTEARVNTYSMVQFETNRYSVPVKYVGKHIIVRSSIDTIEILMDSEVIAIHPRLYGRKQDHLCLDHYLELLLYKSRALNNTRVFNPSSLPAVYEQYRKGLALRSPKANKEFVRILMLHRNHSAELVTAAVEMAMAHKVFSYDGVYNFLIQFNTATHRPSPLHSDKLAGLPSVTVTRPNLNRYNILLQEGGGLS